MSAEATALKLNYPYKESTSSEVAHTVGGSLLDLFHRLREKLIKYYIITEPSGNKNTGKNNILYFITRE